MGVVIPRRLGVPPYSAEPLQRRAARATGRTWPPGVSWYSSDSTQLMASGRQRGTVTAMPRRRAGARGPIRGWRRRRRGCARAPRARGPPGRRSRRGKGSASVSPWTAVAGCPGAISPASIMAAIVPRTWAHLVGTGVEGHHQAPRRAASKAWRPNRSRGRARDPGADAEPVVVDGQHPGLPPRASGGSRSTSVAGGAPGSGFPWVGGPCSRPRSRRRHLPGEAADHPSWPAEPRRARSSGLVEQAGDRSRPARPDSSGGDQQARLPVGAHDLGQGSTGGGDHRHAAGHGLDRRQREAFVERGHDRDLGLAVQMGGVLVVADAADAVHRVTEPEPGDGPPTRPPSLGRPSKTTNRDLAPGSEEFGLTPRSCLPRSCLPNCPVAARTTTHKRLRLAESRLAARWSGHSPSPHHLQSRIPQLTGNTNYASVV